MSSHRSPKDRVPSALRKVLESQLVHHARVHFNSRQPIRILDSRAARNKGSTNASHVLHIRAKLFVYTGTCGSIIRSGTEEVKPAGMIVLLESASGQALHAELNGSGEELAVVRVTAGDTATALQQALLGAGRVSGSRKLHSELRLFRVSSMHLSALWIHHAKRTAEDIFVPYTANFARLRPGQRYRSKRFLSVLKKQAVHMILHWYDLRERGLAAVR